jgi:probable rRNA maturation factor
VGQQIVLLDEAGHARGLKPVMLRAARFLARRENWASFSVNVLITDDEKLRQLNNDFRGLNRTTDVLSFTLQEPDENGVLQAGDIAISTEAAERRSPLPLRQEIVRLFIHGLLHLFGHDHKKVAEARVMHTLTDEAFAASGAAQC